MIRYIHAGYPKCYSTLLQRCFFDAHPDIFHLGVGCGSNTGYHADKIAVVVEHDLNYARWRVWKEREKSVLKTFQHWFSIAEDRNDVRCVGISKETLSVSFPPGSIEPEEKASRLLHLFGPEVRVILIVRQQAALHRSFYREFVRMGFIGSFADYVELVYRYQDRNFCRDFHFHFLYETYANLVGPENVGVFFFENYLSSSGALLADPDYGSHLAADLSHFLDLPPYWISFEVVNPALPGPVLSAMSSLNSSRRHGLGRTLMEGCEDHRLREYWPTIGLSFGEDQLYTDVRTKRDLIGQAMLEPGPALEYKCDKHLWGKLMDDCLLSNRVLSDHLPKNTMPKSYLTLE